MWVYFSPEKMHRHQQLTKPGLQLNCKSLGERSISIAMWVMFAISGLMVGTQLFQGNDAPFYNNGLL